VEPGHDEALRRAERRRAHDCPDHARGRDRGVRQARRPPEGRPDPGGPLPGAAGGGQRMKLVEAFALAISGLSANRLRSALTMLGILIGVAAVILLVAVGNGTSVQIQKQIAGLGSNVVYIYPASTRVGGVSQGFGTGQTLTQADVDALNDK